MRVLKHLGVILLALFITLGLPSLFYVDIGGNAETDAVSSASLAMPEQPSGEFLVLLNTEKHALTRADWEDFFSERPVDVIMEDIACMTVRGDTAGEQLAERYRARLAENQMTLWREDGTLLASRADNGLFDVIVLSREMADVLTFSTSFAREDVLVIPVHGGDL